MPPARTPQDKRGVETLILRSKAITSGNVVKFVHANQTVYRYKKGALTLA